MESCPACPVPLFDGRCVVRGVCHVVGCAATLARMCSKSVLELHCLGAACQPGLPSPSATRLVSRSSNFMTFLFAAGAAGRRCYMLAICQCTYGWQYFHSSSHPVLCLRWLHLECPRVVKQKRKHVDFICLLRFFSFQVFIRPHNWRNCFGSLKAFRCPRALRPTQKGNKKCARRRRRNLCML